MKYITLGSSSLTVPTMAIGCMRLAGLSLTQAESFLRYAIEQGACFFDHADIYGGGQCETIFSEALRYNDDGREKLILQSKCGIRPGVCYDFSKAHILSSVDGILRRLKTDYLDVLLLHRPDALMDPDEVAEAFDTLYSTGKVKHFGVSNHSPMQIELLQKSLHQPLVANQLQMSVAHAYMVTEGLHVNMGDEGAINRSGAVLDYCRLHNITVQPWSPLQYGMFRGVLLNHEKFPALCKKLDAIAEAYAVHPSSIAMAWLLRHPAHLQPVTGTTSIPHLADCLAACDIRLTREEWYEIYLSAGNTLP